MTSILKSLIQFLKEIRGDMMLVIILFAPILTGLFVRFGIPFLEETLCKYFNVSTIIEPYYLIFDIFVIAMAPLMFSFSGIMVILGELDCGISKYLIVTPLGKSGYLFSRTIIPSIIAFFYTIIISILLSLTNISLITIIFTSLISALIGIITSLLILSIASNKVEGMAMTKLSSLLFAGIPVAFFIESPMQYLSGILPSFWMSKLAITENLLFLLPSILVSSIWIIVLYKKFEKKLI